MPTLEVEIAGTPYGDFTLGQDPVLIGSSPDCHVHIEDPAVSERHVSMALEWCVRDLSGDQPVMVKGRRVTRDWLDFGEELHIGSAGRVRLRLRPGPEDGTNADSDERTSALLDRIRALERERLQLLERVAGLEGELEAERSKAPGEALLLGRDAAERWLSELGFEADELLDPSHPGGRLQLERRLALTMRLLLGFAERLEQRTETVMRALSGDREPKNRRTVRDRIREALVEADDDRARERLERHMNVVWNGWVGASLRIYRQGVEVWAQDFLNRLSPRTIQIRSGVSDRKLGLGVGYRALWDKYCALVLNLTAPILVEEIDEAVQREVPR